MMPTKKLFLLDAMALVYRAYYSLIRSPRMTSDGRNTNAQFGFTNTLHQLIQEQQPTHLAVVWDTPAPTERHLLFEAYKANRDAAPEELLAAIPEVKEIVRAFNIPCIEKDGYEADDIIGTLALKAVNKGHEVYMVTPDKDYGQIVRDKVFMFKPGRKGRSFEILGPSDICAQWDIANVEQVIDILAMMGDASDNIPGIKGVGEKTAIKLLKEYGSLENTLANAENIKGTLGKKISESKEQALLSKKLATIITEVPIEFDEEAFLLTEWNTKALEDLFGRLEFKTLAQRILGIQTGPKVPVQGQLFPTENQPQNTVGPNPSTTSFADMAGFATLQEVPHQYHLIEGAAAVRSFVEKAKAQTEITFDTETTSIHPRVAELVGISFSWKKGEAYYIACPPVKKGTLELLEILRPLFEDPDKKWIAQNIKYDLIVLKNYGLELAGTYFDTMLAHYSLAPGDKQGMDWLAAQYLNYQPVPIEKLIGKKGAHQGNMRDVPFEKAKEYAGEDADITGQLKTVFEPLLQKEEVATLFYEVENPLARVLASLEYEGINLDVPFLKEYNELLSGELERVEREVYQMAGTKFNLASPKQLGEILFEKLKLQDKPRKTKTGQYATGEAILSKLIGRHPIIEQILTYRELSKLRSTYVDALPKLVNPETGRLHTSFNQAVVSSGRLSSNNPNLQNIPVRTARGREIRKAFIARDEDHVLFSADYSQIELRVVAALSGDEHMIEAFRQGKDIHRATAAKVYGVSEEEVSDEMRRSAKAVNFGIIYGQSAFGLAENLDINRTEAKGIIDHYFEQYHAIKELMDESIVFAREHGYVKTMKGRKIEIAHINSRNGTMRGFAERVAVNAPIQGSAADMIKLAMINIYRLMKAKGFKSKMILQVHDELIFDVPKVELEEVKALVVAEMEQALPLPNGVPVRVSTDYGDSWLDAH